MAVTFQLSYGNRYPNVDSGPRGTDLPEIPSYLDLARVTTEHFHAVVALAWKGKGGDIGQLGNCT